MHLTQPKKRYKKGIAPIAISYRALDLENDITGGSQIEGFPI